MIVESLFSLPGLGQLVVTSIISRDVDHGAGRGGVHRGRLRRGQHPGRPGLRIDRPAGSEGGDRMSRAQVMVPTRDGPRVRGRAMPVVPAVRNPRSILVYLSYCWLVAVIGWRCLARCFPWRPSTPRSGSPGSLREFGSLDLLLGTDRLGRSLLSRCIYGAQVSLVVGTVAGLVGAGVGTVLGMVAGYFGKRVDSAVRLADRRDAGVPAADPAAGAVVDPHPQRADPADRARGAGHPHVHPAGQGQHAQLGVAGVRAGRPEHGLPGTDGSCSGRSCRTCCRRWGRTCRS